jgi:hypothetical protein
MMVELWTTKREIGDEDGNDMKNPSGSEKSGVQLARLGIEDLVSMLLPTGSGLVPAPSGMLN